MPALCIRRQYTTSLHKGLVHFRSHIRLHSVTFFADYLFLVLIRTFSRTELHKYTDKYHSKSPSILCWYKKWLIAAKVQAGWYQRVCTDVDEQPVAWILTLHVKYRLGQIWVAGKLVPATKMILSYSTVPREWFWNHNPVQTWSFQSCFGSYQVFICLFVCSFVILFFVLFFWVGGSVNKTQCVVINDQSSFGEEIQTILMR